MNYIGSNLSTIFFSVCFTNKIVQYCSKTVLSCSFKYFIFSLLKILYIYVGLQSTYTNVFNILLHIQSLLIPTFKTWTNGCMLNFILLYFYFKVFPYGPVSYFISFCSFISVTQKHLLLFHIQIFDPCASV
jgi:hypothetical protein